MAEGVDLSFQAAQLSKGVPDQFGTGWFSPSAPLPGLAPEGYGWFRTLDYSLATNANIQPRSIDGGLTYAQLRGLAESSDYVNIAIQTVIDRLTGMSGRVVDVNGDPRKPSARADMVNEWIQFPDGVTPLHDFLQRAAYDMCVIDAATAAVDKTEPSKPVVYNVDGATVLCFLDERGRVGKYGQIIKGQVAHHYDVDQLIWMPKNRRPHKIYGFSFVDQIANIVTLALKRTARQLDWFSVGNIPDVLISAPQGWTVDQIKDANVNWDKQLAGVSGKNKGKWFPNGAEVTVLDRNPAAGEFDEWLIRVICYCFSLPPTAFVKETNRATAQTTQDASIAEGHKAILRWAANFLGAIINSAWGSGLKWEWDLVEDPMPDTIIKLVQAKALKPMVLERMGFDPSEIADEIVAAAAPAAPVPPKPEVQKNGHTHDHGAVVNGEIDAAPEFVSVVSDYLETLKSQAVANGQNVFAGKAEIILNDEPGFALRVAPYLEDANRSGVVAASGIVPNGPAPDAVKPNETAAFARERAAWLVGMKVVDGKLVENPNAAYRISEMCRADLRAAVADAFENHLTPNQLAEKIAASASFSPARALNIARTETAFAQGDGHIRYFKAAGVEKKRWTDQDGCPICQDNAHAGAIPVDKAFPSGDMHGPAHPSCRCTVVPA